MKRLLLPVMRVYTARISHLSSPRLDGNFCSISWNNAIVSSEVGLVIAMLTDGTFDVLRDVFERRRLQVNTVYLGMYL